jgi:predicted CXXCH cytochrome family protein
MTMRILKHVSLILVAMAIGIGFGTSSLAFHSGGVAECVGCHNMHGAASTSRLLVGADASSACLTCHEQAGLTSPSSYHVSTASGDMGPGISPFQRTPGGDFGWLKKTYTWVVRGENEGEAGETHGHNVVAADFDYLPDSVNTVAPGGGNLAAANLGCTNCHDPHGKYRRIGGDTSYTIVTTGAPIVASGSYGNSPIPTATEAVGVYRLLAGVGYDYGPGNFAVDPPAASAPSTYNKTESATQTRVAYGQGMAEWCATCHPDMDNGTSGGHHPVSQSFSGQVIDNYVEYRGSGDMTGTNADAYLSLVAYELGDDDYATLKPLALSSAAAYPGPEVTGARVSCISCHRAHASGFEYAFRWNPESEFIVENGQWPGTDNGGSIQFARGRTEAEMQAAYYDRDATLFATYQRQLCNKCHAQD